MPRSAASARDDGSRVPARRRPARMASRSAPSSPARTLVPDRSRCRSTPALRPTSASPPRALPLAHVSPIEMDLTFGLLRLPRRRVLARPAAPDPRDDARLLAAAADGDREAFAELYRRHLPWLLVRLGRRCASPEIVDEVVQDTFVAVWRSAGRWDGRGEVAAWIWGIGIRRL